MKNTQPRKKTALASLASRRAWYILVFASLIFGLLAWLGTGLRHSGPFTESITFLNMRSAAVGRSGQCVVNDSGERRILGLDAEGKLEFILKGERRKGGFYNGRPVGFDTLGRFYVDDTVMDLKSSNTARRQLLRFSENGRLLGAVLRFDFEGEAMSDWESHPFYGQMLDDRFYWFKKGGGDAWKLLSVPLLSERPVSETVLGFNAYESVGIAVLSARELYVLGYDGSVARWTAEGGLEDWFKGGSGGRIRFPTSICVDAQRRLLVGDGKRIVYRLDPRESEPKLTRILSPETLQGAGYYKPVAFQAICPTSAGAIVLGNEFSGGMLTVDASGKVEARATAPLGLAMRILHALSWLALAATGISLASLLAVSYLRLFVGRTPLAIKQLLVFIPLIALMAFAVGAFIFRGMNTTLEGEISNRLLHLAHLGASRVDPGAVEAVDFRKAGLDELLASEPYKKVVGVLDELVNTNQDPWDSQIFPYVYKKEDGVWWVVGSFDYAELYPYLKPEFDAVVSRAESVYFRYDDVYGQWLSACAPVKRPDGSAMAVFEVVMSADVVDEAKRGYILMATLRGGIILAVFLAVFSAFTAYLLRSVRKLKTGAARVAKGDYEVEIDIRSRDEIEELGHAFNTMSREIKSNVESLAKLGKANERFVPREFIDKLGRRSITEVGLGDQVLTDMAVLFSDIRDFTGISEELGPSGTMDFLNDYLARVGPVVRASGGFIDKYVGDSIMALFPGGADDALDAAIGVSAAIDGFRADLAELGARNMEAGIGVHQGPLMLGVIGEEERFDSTVIADAVNLASRIESLTKFYGVRILTSGAVKESMARKRSLRFIDLVRVKGKLRAVRLYELVSPADPDAARKRASAKHYVRGFEAYREGRFSEAADAFEASLAACPGDRPSEILLGRCVGFVQSGTPAGWSGVTEFHEK